ncbi:MAG: hypothetical protein CFE38_00005, partial [Comamonadaceae bacterium PBBC1]
LQAIEPCRARTEPDRQQGWLLQKSRGLIASRAGSYKKAGAHRQQGWLLEKAESPSSAKDPLYELG